MTKQKSTIRKNQKHSSSTSHSASFIKVYWPYLPALLLLLWGFYAPRIPAVAGVKNNVLAYATNTSISGLLQATNSQRTANGFGALSLNTKLNQAAQAKANDMAARNYWSHNTPEGNPPWVFLQNAGYSYQKAGENLAYGFITSEETITGWMNSPSHKANLLDGQFIEVGFGIANNSNYQSNGENTIVVAEYGDPYVLTPSPSPIASPTPPPVTTTQQTTSVKNSTAFKNPIPTTVITPTTSPTEIPASAPVETQKDTVSPSSKEFVVVAFNTESRSTPDKDVKVSLLQQFTNAKAPWVNYALTAIIAIGLSIYVLKHAYAIKKVIVEGETFIIKHPALDVIIIAIVSCAMYLASQAGRVL